MRQIKTGANELKDMRMKEKRIERETEEEKENSRKIKKREEKW